MITDAFAAPLCQAKFPPLHSVGAELTLESSKSRFSDGKAAYPLHALTFVYLLVFSVPHSYLHFTLDVEKPGSWPQGET